MKRKKPRKRAPLSPEQKKRKLQRDHKKLIRTVFTLAGFDRVAKLSEQEFEFKGVKCDIDDLFIYQNIVVLCEYTVVQESGISGHLKPKKLVFDKIHEDQQGFIDFLKSNFPSFEEFADSIYELEHYRVIIAYCSYNAVKAELKEQITSALYLDYNIARYFENVVRTVKKSARFELFEFLGLASTDVGEATYKPTSNAHEVFDGSVLPESHSHFGQGYKVASFYVNPDALLERVYVLRKWSWREDADSYQRMISRKKIEGVRRYLLNKKRVFVNNIIVTLPSETKLVDENGDTVNVASITKTQAAKIQLPKSFNSIGIIDGQHRVFSYYEGGISDKEIAKLRKQQNLLVTGVIFPKRLDEVERAKFEATLFLEINSNQTNAKSDLKQEIGLMLKPYSVESVAKKVVNLLNDSHGPLNNEFQRYFYEKDKLKTTSIVSYGVRPLVNHANADSLFSVWKNSRKDELKNENDGELLTEYVSFCASEINKLVSAAKMKIPSERWTADRKVRNRFLTTTNLNGLIGVLRRLSMQGALCSRDDYAKAFATIDKFSFSKYKSSQYNRMADDLHRQYFK